MAKDGNSLLLSARESAKATLQLWQVSWPGGESRQITNDLSNYVGVSVTDDAKTLVAVETYGLSNLWLLENNRGSEARQIHTWCEPRRWNKRHRLDQRQTNRLLLHGGSRSDLWITRPDGSEQRRVTHNGNGNAYPCMSPDGRWFTFQVGPPLGQHIWRMNLDGSDPKQLTFETEFQTSHAITPDGKWIYYANVWGKNRSF